jgi:hypothetical protein
LLVQLCVHALVPAQFWPATQSRDALQARYSVRAHVVASQLPTNQPFSPGSHSSPASRWPLLHAVAHAPEALQTRPEEQDAHVVIDSPQTLPSHVDLRHVPALHAESSLAVHSTQLPALHTGVDGASF